MRGLGGREPQGRVGFGYEVFEDKVREWGIEERQSMSRYNYD